MRTWTRADRDRLCGNCHKPILCGQPLQEIASAPERRVKTVKLRCVNCADGQPPPDLPVAIEKSIPIPVTSTFPTRVGMVLLPLDYKLAAAGREPGEDG